MTAEPHPQRCETCKFMKEWYKVVPYFLFCNKRSEGVSPRQQELIAKIGCASHSMTAEPQSTRDLIIALFRRVGEQSDLKESWKNMPNAERNAMAGDFYNILAPYIKNEQEIREKVLDELEKYILGDKTKEQLKDAYHECEDLFSWIELRKQGEQG